MFIFTPPSTSFIPTFLETKSCRQFPQKVLWEIKNLKKSLIEPIMDPKTFLQNFFKAVNGSFYRTLKVPLMGQLRTLLEPFCRVIL